MSTVPTVIVDNTIESLSRLRAKVEDARLESLKHPSYGNSATYQRCYREYQQAVRAYRAKNIKLVWNFEDKLMDDIERLVA